MSVERDDKTHTIEFVCNDCGKYVVDEDVRTHEDFSDAWRSHREEGWIAYKVDDEWRHRCPQCTKGRRQ